MGRKLHCERSLTIPTPAPPCSLLSPTHNTPTDHQKLTRSPQPIPLKIKHSTTPNETQCEAPLMPVQARDRGQRSHSVGGAHRRRHVRDA